MDHSDDINLPRPLGNATASPTRRG